MREEHPVIVENEAASERLITIAYSENLDSDGRKRERRPDS